MPENDEPEAAPEFDFTGDAALLGPIRSALGEVYDPEVALSIIDVGLVYSVAAGDGVVRVRMTMTSAACPVGDRIVEDVHFQLGQVLPEDWQIEVELVWDPPWGPHCMSDRGRRLMGW